MRAYLPDRLDFEPDDPFRSIGPAKSRFGVADAASLAQAPEVRWRLS